MHPTISQEVTYILRTATSKVLEEAKQASDTHEESINVEIADLTSQVNFFEIVGPKASQVIKGALSPISQDRREEFLRASYLLNPIPSLIMKPILVLVFSRGFANIWSDAEGYDYRIESL